MKKIFSLLVVTLATMTLSAQTFKVTWNLDGGCANPQCATNKAELFNAFMTDCGLMSKLEAAGVTYDSLLNYVKLNPENPCKNDGIGKFMANTNALNMPQWAWLKNYIISVRGEEPAAGATMNYEVGAFWMSCQNTTWPKSSDYTVKGTDAEYLPAMNAAGQYYVYPAEVAADFVLSTPIKAGYTFLGWYNGENKVEAISADTTLTAKYEAIKYDVTWNLDGGCANQMCATNKAELFNAFMTDCGLMSKLEAAGATYESLVQYVKDHPDNPCKNDGIGKFMTNTNALNMPQWAWLKNYIISVRGEEPAAGAIMNYEVGAFWMSCQNTTWPKSSDYTVKGTDAEYMPAMNAAGIYYELPAQYTIEQELPTPVKAEYTFLGWYNGDTKVEHVDADMTLTAKWERNVYNVTFVAPFAYPNPLFSSDKDMMYAELNADYNEFYGQSSDWGVLSSFTGIADGMPKLGSKMDATFFADSLEINGVKVLNPMSVKWGWLLDYCDTITIRQGKGLASSGAALVRYNVNAFFMNSVQGGWPYSADYAACGVDSKDQEWKSFWGYELTMPDTIAEDYTLPVMYRKNYEFRGWFWNADYTGDTAKVVPVKTNGSVYAKFDAIEGKALLKIELSKTGTVELQMPATDQLTVIFTPETAVNKKVVWSSSDEEILVVDQNGLVTPKAPGKATVKVVSDESKLEASVEYNITAAVGAVTGVTLDQKEVTLEMGKTLQLVATIAPENATNKNVTWTSSSKAASVDENGLVKADTIGTATITVITEDGGYTATCVVTVPEPLDDIVVEKLWEVAIPTKVADADAVRCGMGWNGTFYLTDKKENKIRVFTQAGENVDAAIPMAEGANLGTSIATDDAGNIIVGANFAANDTCVFIVKNGETKMTKIDFASMGGRCDEINAYGDIFSEEGGLVFFYAMNQPYIQYVKIANGAFVKKDSVHANVTVPTGGQSQILYGTESRILANSRGAKAMQLIEVVNGDTIVTDILPKNAITNDLGGAVFSIGENEVWAYKVGTVHSSEFSIRNMTSQQFVADKDGNTVQYIIDKAAATNNSYANFTKAQKINDYAYYLNVFTAGKGAAVYKVYKNVPVESIALDPATAELKAGDKLQLNATITPAYATIPDVEWTTSNAEVATVTETGLVQAMSAGEATITATSVDGNFTATCVVTVKAVTYKLATATSELVDGKKMLIVNAAETYTLGAVGETGNDFTATTIVPANHILTDVPADATIITLGKDNDNYTFAVDGGFLAAKDGASAALTINPAASALTTWTIAMTAEGVATITCTDVTVEKNIIRYYEMKRGARFENSFAAYAATDTRYINDVVIYIERDDQGTDVDNATIKAADDIQKVLIDGTLYIIRGEHIYDATGTVVR